jgi:hypothetical protein
MLTRVGAALPDTPQRAVCRSTPQNGVKPIHRPGWHEPGTAHPTSACACGPAHLALFRFFLCFSFLFLVYFLFIFLGLKMDNLQMFKIDFFLIVQTKQMFIF